MAVPQLLVAYDFLLSEPRQIVIAGGRGAADTQALIDTVHTRFVPNRIILLADSEDGRVEPAAGAPELAAMTKVNGRAAAYVCQNYTCKVPITEPAQLAELLQ
jgi:uncharacterized protein YyaL (SSP411 family)